MHPSPLAPWRQWYDSLYVDQKFELYLFIEDFQANYPHNEHSNVKEMDDVDDGFLPCASGFVPASCTLERSPSYEAFLSEWFDICLEMEMETERQMLLMDERFPCLCCGNISSSEDSVSDDGYVEDDDVEDGYEGGDDDFAHGAYLP